MTATAPSVWESVLAKCTSCCWPRKTATNNNNNYAPSNNNTNTPNNKGVIATTTTTTTTKRLRPNPNDLIIAKLPPNATHIKTPGSLGTLYGSGVPINIEDTSNATIFIYDYTGQITIDHCQNCFIFLAPCEGSLFIRDCRDCTIIAACQQFRARDCSNTHIALYSASQPIIETSSAMKFTCFQYYYEQLEEQFKNAGLDPFSNYWSEIFDFNDSTGKNWSISEMTDEFRNRIKFPDTNTIETYKIDTTMARSIVPRTRGKVSRIDGSIETCLTLCIDKQTIKDFITALPRHHCLIDSKLVKPNSESPLIAKISQLPLSKEFRRKVAENPVYVVLVEGMGVGENVYKLFGALVDGGKAHVSLSMKGEKVPIDLWD